MEWYSSTCLYINTWYNYFNFLGTRYSWNPSTFDCIQLLPSKVSVCCQYNFQILNCIIFLCLTLEVLVLWRRPWFTLCLCLYQHLIFSLPLWDFLVCFLLQKSQKDQCVDLLWSWSRFLHYCITLLCMYLIVHIKYQNWPFWSPFHFANINYPYLWSYSFVLFCYWYNFCIVPLSI